MSSLRTKSDFVIITWGTLQVNRPIRVTGIWGENDKYLLFESELTLNLNIRLDL